MVEFPFWTEDVHEKNEETIDVSLSGEDEHTDDEDVCYRQTCIIVQISMRYIAKHYDGLFWWRQVVPETENASIRQEETSHRKRGVLDNRYEKQRSTDARRRRSRRWRFSRNHERRSSRDDEISDQKAMSGHDAGICQRVSDISEMQLLFIIDETGKELVQSKALQ